MHRPIVYTDLLSTQTYCVHIVGKYVWEKRLVHIIGLKNWHWFLRLQVMWFFGGKNDEACAYIGHLLRKNYYIAQYIYPSVSSG